MGYKTSEKSEVFSFHDVLIEYHVIGILADFDAAFAVLEETAFGYPDGDGSQGLFGSQSIFHLEAFAIDGGFEGFHWVDVLDGEVGAVDHPTVLLQQSLIGVGVFDAFRPQALFGPSHVGSAVGGLDGGDDGVCAD